MWACLSPSVGDVLRWYINTHSAALCFSVAELLASLLCFVSLLTECSVPGRASQKSETALKCRAWVHCEERDSHPEEMEWGILRFHYTTQGTVEFGIKNSISLVTFI